VGGTLVPIGGHSLFEPASTGCPVAFGPHVETVRDMAEALCEHGGGTAIPDASDLGDWVWKLRSDPEVEARWRAGALAAARSVAGGGDRLIDYLTERGLDLR
ncbi:MAG: 3-deoxy-D-manno-octulosonic acid transferase, partial [Candidatus Eisenbacteria bacterium]|nr:3-deoxy-D-manno-octulosonic acid transferase [Candidatus Eisenbacteria bacterium]